MKIINDLQIVATNFEPDLAELEAYVDYVQGRAPTIGFSST